MFIFTNVHRPYKCISFAYALKFSKIAFKQKQGVNLVKRKEQEKEWEIKCHTEYTNPHEAFEF